MGPQKSHGPSGSDWRREWTVGRGADRLPAGGYHKATGWERLGKDTERADREEDDDGDNPRDPDDDANGDHTHLMQTQMGGSSSSGERKTVPQGCLTQGPHRIRLPSKRCRPLLLTKSGLSVAPMSQVAPPARRLARSKSLTFATAFGGMPASGSGRGA